MSDNITIIKICGKEFSPSHDDFKRWQDIFDGKISKEDTLKEHPHMADQKVETVGNLPSNEGEGNRIVLIKIGDEKYLPTSEDLEYFRDLFYQAAGDKDFKIFTHYTVKVEELILNSDSTVVIE